VYNLPIQGPGMKYRQLGSTGLRVSVIGLGTWQLGGEWGQRFTQQEVDELLGRARELGANLLDTAECYGDHLAEALIGTAIHHHRADWVVATKFGHRFHPEAMQQDGRSPVQLRTDHWTPTEVVGQLEASLRALSTDYVDLYQMHSGSQEVFSRHDLWEALSQQVAMGKVRHLGVSLSGGDVDQARRAAEVGASVVQVGYNRLDQTAEQDVLPAGLDQHLGVIVREPLANGYLTKRQVPARRVGHCQRRLALRSRPGRGPAQAGAGQRHPADRGARRGRDGALGDRLVPATSGRQLRGRRLQVGPAAGVQRCCGRSGLGPRRPPPGNSRSIGNLAARSHT
jgi:aryl-alcohol dehydrogenase-like predicted oxidoreductase